MSTPAQKDSERSSRQRGSTECKPLIDASTKDLFRKNAFRITGLSVDLTTPQFVRKAEKLKMLVEIGQDPHTQNAAFPMKPPPSLDEIGEAIRNVKDPEKRLIDEFFWFWPEEFGNSQSDPAMQALSKGDLETASQIWSAKEEQPTDGVVAKHNLALVFHIAALDWENYAVKNEVEEERRQKITDYWKGSFKRWEHLAISEQFWEKVTACIRQINEPDRLPTSFARRMRATLPEALIKINAELALAFAESGRIELARFHIQFMRENSQSLDNFEKIAELVLTPARNRLKEQVRRAKERADKNPRDAANAARELLEQGRKTMFLFDLFFGMESISRNELSDELASVCNLLVIAYDKTTDDYKTSLNILTVVLPYAASVKLRHLIKTNVYWFTLSAISNSNDHPDARLNRFIFEAIPVPTNNSTNTNSNSETGLFNHAATVLREISLEAWNKFQDSATAIAANDLAIKYACDPDLKERLLFDRVTLRKNAEQKHHSGIEHIKYEGSDWIVLNEQRKQKSAANGAWKSIALAWLVVIVIWIIAAIISSCNSTDNSSSNSSYTPSATPSAPTYTPPPASGSRNSGGNVYRVPDYVSSQLDREKVGIEADRAVLKQLDVQLDSLGREIENDRIYLDKTSQDAVDAFNAKVDRYNTLSQQDKAATAAFNERVDSYNAKLRQYGR
jgi:hypothetical protein